MHERLAALALEDGFGFSKFHSGINAEDIFLIAPYRPAAGALITRDRDEVGEIVFTLGIVVGDL